MDDNILHFEPVGEPNRLEPKQYDLIVEPITEAEEKSAKLSPRVIVQDYLYADVAILVAAGGTGKTTLVLYEMIHIVLGIGFWGYELKSKGRCLLITAEDSREICVARLGKLMDALNLTPEQRTIVRHEVRILDVSGLGIKLVETRRDIVLSVLPDAIVEQFKDDDLSLIVFDPLVSFGASEQAVNDNEQALITAGRRIRKGLNCCVRFIHHTGQSVARDKVKDQYAGRGGSALSDGARMVSVLHQWDKSMGSLPIGLSVDDDVLVLSTPKLSYAQKQSDIYIQREGWTFDYFHLPPPVSEEDQTKMRKAQLLRFIGSKLKSGAYLTKTRLAEGYQSEIDMTVREIKSAVEQLLAEGQLINEKLPKDSSQGSRQTYLKPTATTSSVGLSQYLENEGEDDEF